MACMYLSGVAHCTVFTVCCMLLSSETRDKVAIISDEPRAELHRRCILQLCGDPVWGHTEGCWGLLVGAACQFPDQCMYSMMHVMV